MVAIIALVLSSVVFANEQLLDLGWPTMPWTPELPRDDYSIKVASSGKTRLSAWQALAPNNTRCKMVRRDIKKFGYCYHDENEAKGIDTTKQREWVKEVIQQWAKCGGITFEEEEECRTGPDFVTIRIGNYRPVVNPDVDLSTCTIKGFSMLLDFYTFGPYIADYAKTEKIHKSMVQMYALHEFGHFLGFDHEHNRNDRTECIFPQDDSVVGPNAVYHNVHISKQYDLDSVMNYCRPNVHYKPWLSKLDKESVARAYGGGNKAECEAVTKPWVWQDGDGLHNMTLLEIQKDGGYAPPKPCEDVEKSENCEDRKKTGGCSNPGMEYWCYKTCEFCK